MHDQAFKTLEYDQLRSLLRRGAQTPMGQARVDLLTPISQPPELEDALAAVAQCVQLRKRGVVWSFGELTDPAESISRLRVQGAALEPQAILALVQLCEQAMSARASILAERDESPALWKLVADLPREMNSLIARIS